MTNQNHYWFRRILLVIITGLLMACGSKPDHPGVLVDGERLAVVDMHLHTGSWEMTTPDFQEVLSERVPAGFKWLMPILMNHWLSGEQIVHELDKAGIRAGGVFALYSPHSTGIATNEFVEKQLAVNPKRLYGFASIRVDQWNVDSAEQLAKFEHDLTQLDHFIGVKLAHAHQNFRFDDERYYAIYEIAGRLGKPIYLHAATSPNVGTRTEPPYTNAAYLEDAIRRYPRTVFILGHSGYDSYRIALTDVDTCIDLAKRYENVYLEPGALGAKRAAPLLADYLQRIKRAGLASKLIYGSTGRSFRDT
ncbi:MAG: amidohydrolase family protein [Gammaproteobacteria bacterium]